TRGRVALAALRRLRARVFPAAAVLSPMRWPSCHLVYRDRPRQLVQLRDQSSTGTGVSSALLHRSGAARRGSADADQHRGMSPNAGSVAAGHACRSGISRGERGDYAAVVSTGERENNDMKPRSVAIVGAAETTELGSIPNTSQLELHCDAALNALRDAGLTPR